MKRVISTQSVQSAVSSIRSFVMSYGAVFITAILLMMLCGVVHADGGGKDLLATALSGDVQATIGSSGKFWKIFILFDVILAAAAAVKAKNPLVFGGVFMTAFIPAALLKALVF